MSTASDSFVYAKAWYNSISGEKYFKTKKEAGKAYIKFLHDYFEKMAEKLVNQLLQIMQRIT